MHFKYMKSLYFIDFMQFYAAAVAVQLTIRIVAAARIGNAVAIAHIETAFAAVAPDGQLYEPRKHLREARIERARVDLVCHLADQVSAAVGPITCGAVRVDGVELAQNPGAMQKVVLQRVNDDEACADF